MQSTTRCGCTWDLLWVLGTLTERQCHSKKNSVNHSEITQMVEQHVSLKAAKYI